MEQEKKAVLTKYLTCFGIASLITFVVFWIKGFFTDDIGVNIQILSDGFFVSGFLMTAVAGLLFVGGEGGFIGIGFVLRNVIQSLIPMGRRNHELYGKYRERKLAEKKISGDRCILVTGLFFLALGVIFTVIWYVNFYNPPV
ncbi:MAG: DUF3899 domain-containing protein [Clostridia bacterium]|nr:DUF3899 domain-containing protein [Clostridia bacterium]